MKKNNKIKLAALTVTLSVITSQGHIFANAYDDAVNKVKEIENQIKQNEEQIKQVQKEASKYLDELKELDEDIGVYTSKLNELQGKVDDVNDKIKEYEDNLQNSAQKYNTAEDMYMTRIRAIYENGMPSVIDMLFSSKGISDFFSKLNVYQSILDYDKSLVGNFKSEKEYIDYVKKDIETQKLQLDQLKYDVQKSTDALQNAKNAKQAKVNELTNSRIKLLAAVKELKEKEAEANKKVEEELAKLQYNGAFSGQFAWPTPSSLVITASFGPYDPWNTGTYVQHTGADVGVGIGTKVYAAEDGQVAAAVYKFSDPYGGTYKDGYGNYISISHGKGQDGANYATLYGHLSSLVVSKGQTVKKGQLIGYSGSTGNSSGPHLHFEIRKNNKCVNPLPYYNLNFRYL